MAGKITLSGHIEVPESDRDAVAAALPDHLRLTRAEPGNIVFTVTPREDAPGVYDVYEEFVDRAAFDAHQARAKASPWAAATVDVARHYRIAEED